MLLALGGDGRNGNREEGAEKTERVGRETESAVKILEELLIFGYRKNASDIHMEPWEDRFVIRMRIDGMMTMVREFDKSMYQPLVTRAKVISGMDIAKKRVPQDGHFRETIKGIRLDMRTSVIPTIFGEKMVLRFLDRKTEIDHCGTFGMNEENYKKMIQILRSPGGILYLTGTTGCGKTTTLYLILEYLLRQPVNIVTIEDPVERYLPGISQIQVNEQAGLTFESGLRAVLRQDPDIIMVGETRDPETAKISVRAAITGHLVLSTLHTKSAVGGITRMADMGVEPYLTADSLCGMAAQRLVRKVCPHCAEAVELTEEEQRLLGRTVKSAKRGRGCEHCLNTGYKGRTAVHEIFVMDRELKRMTAENRPAWEIEEYIVKTQGMRTMREELADLVCDGVIPMEEFLRTVEVR
jgi:type II secretory pathway, ATPase pulE/tfp pilus assembly pathway, ATPase pilB